MRVVAFLGNGFDKALGLNTGYADFFRDWIAVPADAEFCARYRIVASDLQQIFLRRQQSHVEKWSDFEEALGTLNYSEFRCAAGDKKLLGHVIWNTVNLISSSLHNYLVRQQERFNVQRGTEEAVLSFFVESILHTLGADLIQFEQREDLFISCVTLNYTDSLEKILLGQQSDTYSEFAKMRLSTPIHVHGRLGEQIVFGIDNMDQFSQPVGVGTLYEQCRNQLCKSFRRDAEICASAVKEIDKADIILVYGVSWGSTDIYWWQVIRHALINNASKRLCVCPYSDEMKTMKLSQFKELWKKEKKKSLDAMESSGDERCELASRFIMPRFESRRINGFGIEAGDFLALNTISRYNGRCVK